MTITDVPAPASQRPDRSDGRWLVVLGTILVSFNLRPAVTSLGAMLGAVRADLGIGGFLAGVLTALPVLCFAAFGAVAPALARRLGMHRLVLLGLIAIAVGLATRIGAPGSGMFVAASVLSLTGIAVANVVLPVLIKHHFPRRVGLMTGVYSTSMAVGTSLPAAVTVPVADTLGYGWRGGLGVWALCVAVAVIPWVALQRRSIPRTGAGETASSRTGGGAGLRLARSPTAWGVTGFFGMQSLSAYSIMGWLPQIYRDAGASAELAGYLLAFATMLAIPIALVLPTAAARHRNQSPYVIALVVSGTAGYTGLALAPAAFPWLWALLLGLVNCSFPLALTMIGLRARGTASVAQLSGFAQGIGYLAAATGPLGVGALHAVTGGWGVPIGLLLVCMGIQLVSGLLAARHRYVDDEVGRRPATGVPRLPVTGRRGRTAYGSGGSDGGRRVRRHTRGSTRVRPARGRASRGGDRGDGRDPGDPA